MGYTAYEKMNEICMKKWGVKGPEIPLAFDQIRVWEKDENGRKKKETDFKECGKILSFSV